MELASIIIAIVSVIFTISTYFATVRYEKRKATIEAINLLQNEVLDKFVSIKKNNAKFITENLDDERCKKAYNDYRTLIARLEHFAIGVNTGIYSFRIVNSIMGIHLIGLHGKVKVIIDEANKKEKCTVHYCNFEMLVKKIERKRRVIKNGRSK